MELRQLRTFEAVVRHRTVTEAAITLDLAPSSVSQQIRTLEHSLGVRLFARDPKGMQLTAAGERLRPWAGRLLEQAELAERDVRDQRPILRLGALASIAGVYVPQVLARLEQRRPDIEVDVHADQARSGLLADVAGGALDAALFLDSGEAVGDLGFPVPDAALDFLDLDPVPLALVAAPGHRLAGKATVTQPDLAGERLLVNVPECSFRMAADKSLGPGLKRVKAGAVPVMRAWAERGLGISLLPEFAVADSLDQGNLVRLGFSVPDLSLRLAWRPDQESVPGMREVLYAAAQS
ncbi:LysR family transcriptional regulator [Nocardia stercoris]|uniref:LysR family transcriptional regulator n=1 Tax=Nocardia stercoris TaxID=2483361 RepID=A0A3M2L2J4_9NOCA|nr:LysR family transcriptional regulator [Nocardia stercoris]RMI31932.1 LysR family transcriptional regulator [Nocardia stercoris]